MKVKVPTTFPDIHHIPFTWKLDIYQVARLACALQRRRKLSRERRVDLFLAEQVLRYQLDEVARYQRRFQREYGYSIREAITRVRSRSGRRRVEALCSLVEWDSRWLDEPWVRKLRGGLERLDTTESRRLLKKLYSVAHRNKHAPPSVRSPKVKRLVEWLRRTFPDKRYLFPKDVAERLRRDPALRKEAEEKHLQDVWPPTTYEQLTHILTEHDLLFGDYVDPSNFLKLLARHHLK